MSYKKRTKKFTSNWTVTPKSAVKPLLASTTWQGKRYKTLIAVQISKTGEMVRVAFESLLKNWEFCFHKIS